MIPFQILLVHEASKGSFSRVFDFEANDDLNDDGEAPRTSPFESRFPINIGITGHVAATGEVSCKIIKNLLNLHVNHHSDCNHTKCVRRSALRCQRGRKHRVPTQIDFMHGHQELAGSDHRRHSADQ